MSIPFTSARPESGAEEEEETARTRTEIEEEVVAGGDGASGAMPDEVAAKKADESSDVGSSVDQIREILFGRQMNLYEERFSQLEKRILDITEALRQEIKERLHSLDTLVKEEADALGRRISSERDARTEAVDELIGTVRQQRDTLEKRIEGVEAAGGETADALGAQVLSEAQRAQDALEALSRDFRKTLGENVADLSARKTDRQALASLLTDMASRLAADDNEGA